MLRARAAGPAKKVITSFSTRDSFLNLLKTRYSIDVHISRLRLRGKTKGDVVPLTILLSVVQESGCVEMCSCKADQNWKGGTWEAGCVSCHHVT